MSSESHLVGQQVARTLRELGVEVVFGIPGVHTIELYRGLAEAGIQAVTPRHEQGAGFMADGYARVSGRPGVCVLISGPGLTNAITPLAQAFHDSVPVLIVASTTARGDLGRGRGVLHDLPDQAALVRSITCLSETARSAAEAPNLIQRAWATMQTGRRRPAHVAIPVDLLAEPSPGSRPSKAVAQETAPDPQLIDGAAALLRQARRPAILLGGGAVDAGSAIAELAERLDAPVALTGNATGTVASSHPLCLGARLPFRGTRELLAEADVALLVGTELSEVDVYYTGETPRFSGSVIRVDIDPGQLDAGAEAAVSVVGDAGAVCAALLERVPGRAPAGGADRAARARDDCEWTALSRRHMPWIDAIDAALPADRIVALDSTQLAYTAQHTLPIERPRSFLAPYGWGTLGPAVPMAIGGKLAAPDRPVLALAGDGGLLFTVTELGTAVDLKLGLPVVVWDNDGYGEIRDYFDRASAPRLGTEVVTHNLLGVAAGLGCATATASTPDELAEGISTALRQTRPTVIRVRQGD